MSIDVVKIQEFKGHTQAVYALAYDMARQVIYSGAGDGMVVAWQLHKADGELKAKLDSAVYSLNVSKQFLYAGSRMGSVFMFQLNPFNQIKQAAFSRASVFEIIALQDGRLALACEDGYIRLTDAYLNLIWQTKISVKSVRTLIEMHGELYAGTSDGTIVKVNLKGDILETWQAHNGTVFSLAINPRSKSLFSGGKDACIKMFENGGEVQSVPAHLLHVHRLCINYEREWMLSSSMDKTVKVWEIKGLRLIKVIDFERNGGHTSSVNKILWIDKNTIISCSDDRTLKCFEIKET